ncbi:hypothetical protein CVT24_009549 [Panaeolus cyanescens]|uniref:Probable RNA-binding protein 18 n=1 Tax=Panaeolus cyanescens TaxID=181874 RepID=A0A409YAF2_9AGAR|nr:hypothetical protein CVT24_009549 [Panaeolus cyanescens]
MASSSIVTLDDLAPPIETSTSTHTEDTNTIDDHIHFPAPDEPEFQVEINPHIEQAPRQLLKDRLYIGNLHPTVDEYTLLQVFSKFGKVTKLDFLFHKAGLMKGKPRGYAFIEYGNADDALKALTIAHDKPLRGRKLVVTFAHQAPLDQYTAPATFRSRKQMMETGRPTTLSMIKTGLATRHESKTSDKIAMMEAKLRQMEASKPRPTQPTDKDVEMSGPSTSSSLPYHPSLPMKPPAPLPGNINPQPSTSMKPKTQYPPKNPPSLSSLLPSVKTPNDLLPKPILATNPTPSVHRHAKSAKSLGIKIKAKEKPVATKALDSEKSDT